MIDWGKVITAQERQKAEQAAIEQRYTGRLEAHFDDVAAQRRYYNRATCAARAAYPGPFYAEGLAFAVWMDECNLIAYRLLAEASAGLSELPSEDELIDLLPPLEWPPSPV